MNGLNSVIEEVSKLADIRASYAQKAVNEFSSAFSRPVPVAPYVCRRAYLASEVARNVERIQRIREGQG